MSGGESKQGRKQAFFSRILSYFDEYERILIVTADNVGSNHMQKIRIALRGVGAVLLMGKNTMIRKALRGHLQSNPNLENLLPHIRGNVGFIFTKGDISAVKKLVDDNKVEAAARAGAIAPTDVIIPAGNTGLEPTKTSFFQALQIATRITKGAIEITSDVKIITAGNKVGPSEAALLQMLNIRPFKYGLLPKTVYEGGSVYEASFLDISSDDILAKFREGVKNVAAVSLAVGYPTLASVPHSVVNGYKNVLSIALATNYSFPQADKIKTYLANPTAHAVPAKGGEEKKGGGGKKEEGKKDEGKKKEEEKKKKEAEEKKKKEEEEEEGDMGLGLFD